MKYYIEIAIFDESKDITSIWSKLYMQLHLALVATKNSDNTSNVGFYFPEYHYNHIHGIGCIGSRIRLFSRNKQDLMKTMAALDISQLNKNLHLHNLTEVPHEGILGYAMFVRQQDKANPERLARRYHKRHSNLKYENILNIYKNSAKNSTLPHITMNSLTNKSTFSIFLKKKNVDAFPLGNGKFTTYGLAIETPIPEF
ncbi:MAG: type I-F CRISPR-associated endoribonuclease Cas6/Csy4 [Candidatus Riflebacteria bacterium]|nr:type I-F CRISPR-associated endoribonuclease Cas6/Csy4 [Candidatus Riflebacteria bacterium]